MSPREMARHTVRDALAALCDAHVSEAVRGLTVTGLADPDREYLTEKRDYASATAGRLREAGQ